MRRLTPGCAVIVGSVITAVTAVWFGYTSGRIHGSLFIVFPGIALTAMLVLGSDTVLERLRSWVGGSAIRIAAAPASLWILYLAYASGMRIATITAMAAIAIYLAAPFVVLSSRSGTQKRLWLEPVAILCLWLPLELGIIRRLLISTGRPDLHYAFAQVLAMNAGIIAFTVWAGLGGTGYRFEFSKSIVRDALSNFLLFACIAIPLGMQIDFIRFDFHLSELAAAPVWFAGIFLFTAVPEEFLFRGLIQNWLARVTRNGVASLVVGAVIFGASHLNNGPPIPNYRYFLMATVAGVFYGRAWRNSGNLMASCLTHALVDTVWSVFFR